MSHKQTDSYNETIREGAAQECKCGEITLSPEPSTMESYIVEWYCSECGHFECRVNREYERKAQELEAQRNWWTQLDADSEWIEREG